MSHTAYHIVFPCDLSCMFTKLSYLIFRMELMIPARSETIYLPTRSRMPCLERTFAPVISPKHQYPAIQSELDTPMSCTECRCVRLYKLADRFPGASAIRRSSTSLPATPESQSSKSLSNSPRRLGPRLSSWPYVSVPILSSSSPSPLLSVQKPIQVAFSAVPLVTKKMTAFQRPCSGRTAAVATWYSNGLLP